MTSVSSDQKFRQNRLDTWKSIAQHLGRSSRTVQRWHSAYGLPVHHLSGESGSVYAYADDLDTWLRSRGRNSFASLHEFPANRPAAENPENGAFDRRPEISELSLISLHAKAHSDQLVALATQRWESFSHRNLPAILSHYREAIDLNPGNAAAYAGLSLGLIAQATCGLVNPPVAYSSARAALQSALNIDPELPLAKCGNAWLALLSTRDWRNANRDFNELLMHSPACVRAMNGRALLYVAEGALKEASELFSKAAQHNPLSSASMPLYCWSEYLAGEFAYALHRVDEIRATGHSGPILDAVEALASIQHEDRDSQDEDRKHQDHNPQHEDMDSRIGRIEALAAESPQNDVVRGALGYAYAVKGQEQKARRILEAMTYRAKGRLSHEPYGVALILVGLNDRQHAINALEQSYRAGSLWSLGFRSDPALAALRNDPHSRNALGNCSYPESDMDDVRFTAAS
jgi:tetratricopeptide (TPR) repeat protein